MRSSVATLARRLRPRRRTAAPVDQPADQRGDPDSAELAAPPADQDANQDTDRDAEARPAKRGRPRARRAPGARLRLVLAVATVLAAGAAGAGWYAHHRAEARDTAVRQAMATATPAAKAIFSYDYRSFDASVTNGRSFVTGAFAEEYAETTAALKTTAIEEQAVVLAEVSATGVIRADPDRVELLVYLNQYRRNANTDGEKVDQNRVVLELRRVGTEWKVSRATAI